MALEDSLLDSIYYEAAGGVLVHKDRVLILFRPALGEVRLPKGHIDPGESAAEAALREVEEECGTGHLVIQGDLGSQEVTFILDGRQVIRHERYFLMGVTTAEPEQVHPPEPQFEPRWHRWETAEAYLTFEAEKEWVRRARTALSAAAAKKED